MASLKIVNGARAGEVVELTGDSLTLGRGSDNDLSVADDARMSRHHARLQRQGVGWQIEDLQSSNGTRIERAGEPVRVAAPTLLADGDVIVVGSLHLGVALDPASDELGETMVLDVATEETLVAAPPVTAPQPAAVGPAPQQIEADDAGDFDKTRIVRPVSYTPLVQPTDELVPAAAPGLRPARAAARRAGHRVLGTLVVFLPALILALVALYFTGIK